MKSDQFHSDLQVFMRSILVQHLTVNKKIKSMTQYNVKWHNTTRFLHYSHRASADKCQGTNFWTQQRAFVSSVIMCEPLFAINQIKHFHHVNMFTPYKCTRVQIQLFH